MQGGVLRGHVVRALAIGMLLAVFAWAPSAQAAFPGQNGKIAFSEGGVIWSINPDGTGQTMLRDGYEPAWSHDGSQLLFTREHDIRVMPADGITETVVLDAPGGTPDGFFSWRNPAWSPDGTKFVTGELEDSFNGFFEGLSTASADGSGVIQSRFADGTTPSWSPNGAEIAYVSKPPFGTPGGIYAIAPDGTGMRTIWEEFRETSAWPAADPDYSPDGSKIIFSTPYPGNDWQIYVAPAAGGPVTRLTNNDNADIDAVWSPDGTKIAFASDRDGNFEIYTMNADGTNQTRVTNNPAEQVDPTWQPVLGTGYVRPKGAAVLRLSLVPAYQQCTSPNRQHGPPLAFPSCGPPARHSSLLTVGTSDANGAPANMEGNVRFKTDVGDPTTPEDTADVEYRLDVRDVRMQGTLLDYTGELESRMTVSVIDRTGSPGGPAITTDFALPLTVPCASTPSLGIGATCALTTTIDTLIPGAIVERDRTVIQLSPVEVIDGGIDGDTATEPNSTFLRPGIFVP